MIMAMETILLSVLAKKAGLWKSIGAIAGLIGLLASLLPGQIAEELPGREDPDPNRGGGGSGSG